MANDMILKELERLFDCEKSEFQLEEKLGINPFMRNSFLQDIEPRAEQLRKFAEELENCDIIGAGVIACIVIKGAEVLERRNAGQLNFSGFEIQLLVTANDLFDDLVERRLHQSSKQLVSGFTLKKIPKVCVSILKGIKSSH